MSPLRPLLFLTLVTGLLLAGCESLGVISEIGAAAAVSTGYLNAEQGESLRKTGSAVGEAFTEITPEQEYFIGRAVGATVTARYRPADAATANHYLNLVGQTLASASDLPETFGGYHFLLLESEEINAFAAPGGLIFVTRGMLRCCRDEDALAAVLAHEIGHVQLRHGLQAIKKSRLTSALTILGTEGAKQFAGQQLADLTSAFAGSIGDITATLVNNGYSRAFEREADHAALALLQRVGYDPAALTEMLGEMQRRLKPGGADFARTHPEPAERIEDLAPLLKGQPTPERSARSERFRRALGEG